MVLQPRWTFRARKRHGTPWSPRAGETSERGSGMMKLIVADLLCLDHYVSREFSYIIRDLIENHGWSAIGIRGVVG
jgi:hypothetical protein